MTGIECSAVNVSRHSQWLELVLIMQGCFPSTKISVWSFGNSTCPAVNGMAHSGCTDPTQATTRLVIVLVGKIQKSGTGDNNFAKCKVTCWSDRQKWPDRSTWTTFKGVPKYSGRTEMVRFICWFLGKNSEIFGWTERGPGLNTSFAPSLGILTTNVASNCSFANLRKGYLSNLNYFPVLRLRNSTPKMSHLQLYAFIPPPPFQPNIDASKISKKNSLPLKEVIIL